MSTQQLPILETISDVVTSIKNNSIAILRMGLPVIVVSLISSIYYGFFAADGVVAYADLSGIGILITILSMVAYIMAVVGIHRVFLLPPGVTANTFIFRWSSRESRFIGWLIFMSLCLFPIAIVMGLLLVSLFAAQPDTLESISRGGVMMAMLISLPVYYIIARWSLVLPSTAVDGNLKGLSDSWKLSIGNGFSVFVLVGLVPLLTSSAFGWLYSENSALINLGVQVLGWLAGTLEIGLLSHSYAFLARDKVTDTNSSEIVI